MHTLNIRVVLPTNKLLEKPGVLGFESVDLSFKSGLDLNQRFDFAAPPLRGLTGRGIRSLPMRGAVLNCNEPSRYGAQPTAIRRGVGQRATLLRSTRCTLTTGDPIVLNTQLMGISHRLFLIDHQDRLYRLAAAKFDAMLRRPISPSFPQFAGQRVRTASTSVQMIDRQPVQVVRITFDVLTFDDSGCFKPGTYLQQQWSRAELAMAPVIGDCQGSPDVVDAASRFIAHGGRWTPSQTLARAIHDAALGRTKCTQL